MPRKKPNNLPAVVDARESRAAERHTAIKNRIGHLFDPQKKILVVRTKEDADLAGETVTLIAEERNRVKDDWEDDLRAARQLLSGLRKRFQKADLPLESLERALKEACRQWIMQRRAMVQEETRRLQALADEEDIAAPVVILEKPKIADLNSADVWRHRVLDLAALVEAVREGFVPDECIVITANDAYLAKQARVERDARAVEKDGKKFIYPGVEVYLDVQMRRE